MNGSGPPPDAMANRWMLRADRTNAASRGGERVSAPVPSLTRRFHEVIMGRQEGICQGLFANLVQDSQPALPARRKEPTLDAELAAKVPETAAARCEQRSVDL